MYFDCTIAGFGGQGVMLMGNILVYAAMEEKKKVTYMPVYGVEMRGGTANCTVVISDKNIGSPVTQWPESAIIMNQPSLEKFGPRVKKGGLLVINSTLVSDEGMNFKGVECLRVPTRDLALEIGNDRLTNMVILGATAQRCGAVKIKSMTKALYSALDKRYHNMIDINTQAIERGAEYAATGK